MNHFKKIALAGIIIAILLIALFISLFFKSKSDSDVSDAERLQNSGVNLNGEVNPIPTQTTSNLEFTYEYVPDRKEGDPYELDNLDGKIFQTNTKTKARTIVVPSVMKAYPPLKGNGGQEFYQISASNDKPFLYFSISFIEGAAGIIRYDGSTNKFTKLKINDYFNTFEARASKISPYAVSTENANSKSDERSLFLLDLDNDTVRLLTKLPQKETFNPCPIIGCLGDSATEVTWLDKENFQITVYDANQTIPTDGRNTEAKVIEKRKFNINK